MFVFVRFNIIHKYYTKQKHKHYLHKTFTKRCCLVTKTKKLDVQGDINTIKLYSLSSFQSDFFRRIKWD